MFASSREIELSWAALADKDRKGRQSCFACALLCWRPRARTGWADRAEPAQACLCKLRLHQQDPHRMQTLSGPACLTSPRERLDVLWLQVSTCSSFCLLQFRDSTCIRYGSWKVRYTRCPADGEQRHLFTSMGRHETGYGQPCPLGRSWS